MTTLIALAVLFCAPVAYGLWLVVCINGGRE